MTTIVDAALRNFRAAVELLEALQFRSLDMVGEVTKLIGGGRGQALEKGYNGYSPTFGVCVSQNGSAKLINAEASGGFELRSSGIEWITLEGVLTVGPQAASCCLELKGTSSIPTAVEVFVRESFEDGTVSDSGHRRCELAHNTSWVGHIPLPESAREAGKCRLIVYLVKPNTRILFERIHALVL